MREGAFEVISHSGTTESVWMLSVLTPEFA